MVYNPFIYSGIIIALTKIFISIQMVPTVMFKYNIELNTGIIKLK